jgi:hypothetical protein
MGNRGPYHGVVILPMLGGDDRQVNSRKHAAVQIVAGLEKRPLRVTMSRV